MKPRIIVRFFPVWIGPPVGDGMYWYYNERGQVWRPLSSLSRDLQSKDTPHDCYPFFNQ